MNQYQELLEDCLYGNVREDRTGVGTSGVFGRQLRFDLDEGFPILTTKRVHTKSIIHELLWFISGSTNISYLRDKGVKIWDEWADVNGDLGPVYGKQWRSWSSYSSDSDGIITKHPLDQLTQVIEQIKENPYSRRHIVSAWNPSEVDDMALPPCHLLFQFYVEGDRLSCQLYQRSADVFLGVPFNIASYALLTQMVALVTGYIPGEFVHTFGDVHLYKNHRSQALELLTRNPKRLPVMVLTPDVSNITDFKYEDFELLGYNPHPSIKAEVAV